MFVERECKVGSSSLCVFGKYRLCDREQSVLIFSGIFYHLCTEDLPDTKCIFVLFYGVQASFTGKSPIVVLIYFVCDRKEVVNDSPRSSVTLKVVER
jgi:hypothetical protein